VACARPRVQRPDQRERGPQRHSPGESIKREPSANRCGNQRVAGAKSRTASHANVEDVEQTKTRERSSRASCSGDRAGDTSLTVTSPATSTAGTVDVTVTTPLGTSATSSADQFTYQIGGTVSGGTQPGGTLAVTSITPIKTNGSADGSYENGWSYLFNITVPTSEPNLSMKFADWFDTASDTLPVAGNMRISSAQAASTSPVTITAANTYSMPPLHMIGNMSTTTTGLHVQVLVEVKIPLNTVNGSYTTTYGVQTLP